MNKPIIGSAKYVSNFKFFLAIKSCSKWLPPAQQEMEGTFHT